MMDIAKRAWAPAALEATAPNLFAKQQPILESDKVAAKISAYFVERFGFSPGLPDPPRHRRQLPSLDGLGLVSGAARSAFRSAPATPCSPTWIRSRPTPPAPRMCSAAPPAAIWPSRCTRTEASRAKPCAEARPPRPVLRHPAPHAPGQQRPHHAPYFGTEIVPHVQVPGPQRYGFEDWDGEAEVRAVVEAQMTSTAIHAEWMGEKPVRIQATGGASDNREILQIMADVFGVPGAAPGDVQLRGPRRRHPRAACRLARSRSRRLFEQLTIPFVRATYTLQPDLNNAATYAAFARAYRQYEEAYLKTLK